MITTKQCFKCSKTKPLTAFYKHSQMLDGHLNKCKECTKVDSNNHRYANIEKVREYDRNRGFRGTKGKIYLMSKQKTKILYKCIFCGSNENLENHHPDYNKPSFLVTLCRKCHRNTHSIIRLSNEEIHDLAVF